MATVYGTVANSSSAGGWRAAFDYTIDNTDRQTVTVSIPLVYACPVNTAYIIYAVNDYSGTLKFNGSIISSTINYINNGTDPNVRWGWRYSYSPYQKDIIIDRGHETRTANINVNVSLVSFGLEKGSQNVGPFSGASTANVQVEVPALDSYAVTLDANGGTGAAPTLTKWYGENLTLPQPVKDGYSFAGWAYYFAPTTVEYAPGVPYTRNASVSLVAVWTPIITSAVITQLYAARDDGRGMWDAQNGKHISASDDGEYVYIRAWWRVDGTDAATISLGADMADTSTVWTGATRTASKPGTGELYLEGVAEWLTSQTALVTGQYDVTVTLSTGQGNPSDTRGTTISTAFFTIDVLAGGHGIAFGKPATQQLFDVGMETNFDQDVTVGGDLAADGDLVAASLSTTGNATVGGDIAATGELSGATASISGNLTIGNPTAGHTTDSVVTNGSKYSTVYDENGSPVWRFYISSAGSLARQEYSNGSWEAAQYFIAREEVASLFSCSSISQTIGAVAAGSTKTLTFSAERDNYRPIAISGWYVNGAASLYPYMLRLNGTNIQCYLRNPGTSASSSTAKVDVQVLYCRNSW